MHSPVIAPPQPEDAGDWFDFLVAQQAEAYRGIVPDDFADRQRLQRDERVQELRERFAAPGTGRRLAAKVAGRIVGVVSVVDAPMGWETALGFVPAPEPRQLDRLYLHPEFRNRGLGSALLDAVDDGRDLYLWLVSANRAAQRFYRRHGFVDLDESHRAGQSWGGVAMHRMVRRRP